MTVTHSTFTLERHFAAPIERVFEAWADPAARRRWMAGGADHEQDFVVGGHETVRGFDGQGRALTHDAVYVDIVPEERILTTSTLHAEDQLSTVSTTSIEFVTEEAGTLVTLTEHGIHLPGEEQPEWRKQGTAQQLDTLVAEFTATTTPEEN